MEDITSTEKVRRAGFDENTISNGVLDPSVPGIIETCLGQNEELNEEINQNLKGNETTASPDLSALGLQELSSNADRSKDEIDEIDHGPGELEGEMNGDVVPTSVTNTIVRSDTGQPTKLSEIGDSKEQHGQHTTETCSYSGTLADSDSSQRPPSNGGNVETETDSDEDGMDKDMISKAASDPSVFLTFQQRAPRNHDEPGYATSRMVLVSIYLKKFEITKNPQDVKKALICCKEAIGDPLGSYPTLPKRLYNLTIAYSQCYEGLVNQTDIEAALRLCRMAMDVTPSGIPALSRQQLGHALSLMEHYDMLENLDDTQILGQKVLDSTLPGHLDLSGLQYDLAVCYIRLYKKLGRPKDLQTSMKLFQLAVDNTSAESPKLINRQWKLAMAFSSYYDKFGNMDDLDFALEFKQKVVDGLPSGHQDLTFRQYSLAASYGERFQKLGHITDMESAILYYKAALEHTPPDDPAILVRQEGLALAYMDYFDRFGHMEDLEAALNLRQISLDATPANDPGLPDRQHSLAMSFGERFQRLGNLEDMEAALKFYQLAVNGTPLSDPELPTRQQGLAVSYQDRYFRLGHLEDLEAAMDLTQKALDATEPDDLELPDRQHALALCYGNRFQRLGKLQDMEAALKLYQLAVDGTPQDHTDLLERKKSLAISYTDRYERLGDLKDLETALQIRQEVLQKTPLDHPDLADIQEDLGISYGQRYQRTGDFRNMEDALYYYQKAVDNTPKDHPDLATRQNSLAISYLDRYERIGDIEDLDAAQKFKQMALDATESDDPGLCNRHHALAMCYQMRYERNKSMKDLEYATSLFQKALDGMPPDHPDIAFKQQSLAQVYLSHYKEYNSLKDLKSAIEFGQMSVNGIPQDHPDLPNAQKDLAAAYKLSYRRLGHLEDLESALSLTLQALQTLPPDHADLSLYQTSLAVIYKDFYTHLGEDRYLESALDYGFKSIRCFPASPVYIWQAAASMASWSTKLNRPESLEAYSHAFDILPQVLWIGSSLDVRHVNLVEHKIPEVTASAVAAAIDHNKPEIAVEFFEQGLSITHRQSLELKDHNILLLDQFPSEALRIKELSWQLMQATNHSMTTDGEVHAAVNYHLIANERQELIRKVRTFPGFERFLSPPSYKDLAFAAVNGPIIMLNCRSGSDCSDALVILSPSLPIERVPLPSVSEKTANIQLHNLKLALRACGVSTRNAEAIRSGRIVSASLKPEQLFQDVISWLLKLVVQPVFALLQSKNITQGRIWWCPSGPFTYLPIHAAAPLGSLFIQSYTLTLQALLLAQKKDSDKSFVSPEPLTTIGVAQYPGQSYMSLPLVEAELCTVEKACGGISSHIYYTEFLNSDATVDSVLQHIKTSTWLHLACHGQQDPTDPLKSCLLLYDGNLELQQIIDTPLSSEGGKFVFLSACQTATGDEKLANEAMHLAGGFIAAGFQGAIGTLWSMADLDGPTVAEIVYQNIFMQGRGPEGDIDTPDVTLAAQGLHLAIQKLRQDGVPFQRWMPYIHFGI